MTFVGGPACVTMAAAEPEIAEVPRVADTVPESPAWLLGWNVVEVVPSEPDVPEDGVKLYEVPAG